VAALSRRLPWLCVVLLVLVLMAPAGRVIAAPFAAVVMDARNGEILHSQNHMTRLHPASLTKMMTLYIAFEAISNNEISLDTRVTISAYAASRPPSRLGLRAGQRIAMRHLIRAAALRSGNDAATAIAEAISGSEAAFAARMNQTAAAMGMTHTRFRNAHGLTQEGHLSSARDMAILSRHIYFDFPQYYNLFSRRSEDAGVAVVRNTNSRFLDGYRGADGIKTGFTNAAGYNLAAMAERGSQRIIVVVFGGRSVAHRHEQVVRLMDRGFAAAPARVAIRRPARPDYTAASQPTGVASGRVIRLQTAPVTSPLPRRRPDAAPDPAIEAVVASIVQEVEAVLNSVELAAAPAPEVSRVPPSRPDDDVLAAAREVGFTTVTEVELATRLSDAPAPALSELAMIAPPPTRDSPLAEALITESPITEQPEIAVQSDVMPDQMQQFVHESTEIARVIIEEGLVVIPGLPPIATAIAPSTVPEAEAAFTEFASIAAIAEDLQLGPDGEVLWRDEELLSALSDAPDELPMAIVLTASDNNDQFAAAPPAQEIVSRISTAGVRLWSVGLGQHPSRFDAERTLLRLALTESNTLGAGQRRVVQRQGRFVATVEGLSEDQAALACLRLGARGEACDVIAP